MAVQIAKFLAPLIVVGAPIVTTTSLLAWKLGALDEKESLNVWLDAAIRIGGGGENNKKGLETLKTTFKGGISNWTHPGLFVETVGEYMGRVFNKKNSSFGKELKFNVKGAKTIVEKVGFKYDGSRGLKLDLGINGKSGAKFTRVKEGNKLCVISVAEKGGPVSLNLLVGFFSRQWDNKKPVIMEESDQVIGGYEDWCERRAGIFNKENNLVVGIHLNPLNVTIHTPSGPKITGIDYYVNRKGVGFIGKDTTKTGPKGWSRTCASRKESPTLCHQTDYPFVLGVIGNKKFNSLENSFEDTAIAEDFSEIYLANGEKPKPLSSIVKSELEKPPLNAVPVGVKFTNVNVTGKTLEDWSRSPE